MTNEERITEIEQAIMTNAHNLARYMADNEGKATIRFDDSARDANGTRFIGITWLPEELPVVNASEFHQEGAPV